MVGTNGIIPGNTPWLHDPAAQRVCAALQAGGYQALFVGGCVRNALLGLPAKDVDISTDARPDQVTELAGRAGLKAIPTGIEHGTITVIADDTPYEVTTFRQDVETDGRRAVVAFSDNITDDARRRDFTVNALYATPQGELVDPLGGLPDLRARRIRFIEDPVTRIKEDYLRILRYFRFYAWYADQDAGFDPDALAAIAANAEGLGQISSERVGHEMRNLLAAPDPAPSLAGCQNSGVLLQVLPGADSRWIAPLIHIEQNLGVDPVWMTRLAALGGQDAASRLRLSRSETKQLDLLLGLMSPDVPLAEIAYRQGQKTAISVMLLRGAVMSKMPDSSLLETIFNASQAIFPVSAADLMPRYQGPALGDRLRMLESDWIKSGFTMDKNTLLSL